MIEIKYGSEQTRISVLPFEFVIEKKHMSHRTYGLKCRPNIVSKSVHNFYIKHKIFISLKY